MKHFSLIPIFVKYIPKTLEEGKMYISEEFELCVHLCACGCGGKTVLPFGDTRGWKMTKRDNKVTFRPSIGNWSGESPYHAHYYITENAIEWL